MKNKLFLIIASVFFAFLINGCTGGVKTSVDGSATSKSSASKTLSESYAEAAPDDISTVSEEAGRDKGEGLKNAQLENTGLLTAGEWNDNENWDFWTDLMKSKEWTGMQKHWEFYTTDKISVIVKAESGQLVEDASVILETTDGKKLWTARTDVFGKAELFPAIFSPNQSQYQIKITNSKGESKTYTDIKQNGINELTFSDITEPEPILDLMFVTDATGSMGDELTFLQAELSDIIGKVNSKAPELTVRIGNVFYRDKTDDYLVRDFDFSTDIAKVQRDVNEQSAGGGGDYEEAVEAAIYNAVKKQSWSKSAKARLLFLILDAPPHHTPGNIKKIHKAVEYAAEKGIKIIPVSASGIEKDTEFLLRFLAISTNGTYTFLTDDSGIGNAHLKPTTGKYEVEYLNDLMIRLILKYTGHKLS